jgi:hypothetical protein
MRIGAFLFRASLLSHSLVQCHTIQKPDLTPSTLTNLFCSSRNRLILLSLSVVVVIHRFFDGIPSYARHIDAVVGLSLSGPWNEPITDFSIPPGRRLMRSRLRTGVNQDLLPLSDWNIAPSP